MSSSDSEEEEKKEVDSQDEDFSGSDCDSEGEQNVPTEDDGEVLAPTPRGKSKLEWGFGYEAAPIELPEYKEKKEFQKLEVPVKRV